MQTFCLLKELLCIADRVYRTILQTQDDPVKRKKAKKKQYEEQLGVGEIFVDCFHSGWAQAVGIVEKWL